MFCPYKDQTLIARLARALMKSEFLALYWYEYPTKTIVIDIIPKITHFAGRESEVIKCSQEDHFKKVKHISLLQVAFNADWGNHVSMSARPRNPMMTRGPTWLVLPNHPRKKT